jgi:hypothetical protein
VEEEPRRRTKIHHRDVDLDDGNETPPPSKKIKGEKSVTLIDSDEEAIQHQIKVS